MTEIRYSKAAICDMEEIGDYIAKMLKNPRDAFNTVSKIQDSIDKLADFPLIGAPLSSIVLMDMDYRFLVCGNYLAFYRMQENSIYIDRVLYCRRDYISLLFSGEF